MWPTNVLWSRVCAAYPSCAFSILLVHHLHVHIPVWQEGASEQAGERVRASHTIAIHPRTVQTTRTARNIDRIKLVTLCICLIWIQQTELNWTEPKRHHQQRYTYKNSCYLWLGVYYTNYIEAMGRKQQQQKKWNQMSSQRQPNCRTEQCFDFGVSSVGIVLWRG